MSVKIRVGVVGAGFGARVLIPAFRSDKRCQVTALAASSQAHARKYAAQLNLSKAFGDWKKITRDPEVDIVVIAVPPDLQFSIALDALKHGKAVFCEKPVAVKLSDAKKLMLYAQQKMRTSAVDHEFPEVAAFQAAKKMIAQNKLGRLRHIDLAWQVETFANAHRLKSWKNDEKRGGGALFSFVSHSFYYMEWLFGPIAALNARIRTAPDLAQTQDTLCMMRLFFKRGIYANVTVSTHALHGTGHRLEVYGSEGSLILHNGAKDHIDGFKLFYGSRRDTGLKPASLKIKDKKTSDGRIGAVSSLVSRFLDAYLKGGRMQPDLTSGYRVQQLIAAAKKSSDLAGKAIWV